MDIVLIYVTNPSFEQARSLAKHLMDKNLIACANFYDQVRSLYYWKGQLVDDTECVMIAKTTEERFEEAKIEIEKVHPYEIPCILRIDATANEAFSGWLRKELVDRIAPDV